MNNSILLVIGAAPCTGDDLVRFFDMMQDRSRVDYMLIGLDSVEMVSEPCKYFATYHPAEIGMAKERRHKYGGNTDYKVIAHHQHQAEVDLIVPIVGPSGSSSMLGCLAGLREGYNKIVMCGCPLDGTNTKGDRYESFRAGWQWPKNSKQVMGNVKSMSGWTAEFLGSPTEEWLDG